MVEVLPILGQSAAAAEPRERAFDDPSQGQDDGLRVTGELG